MKWALLKRIMGIPGVNGANFIRLADLSLCVEVSGGNRADVEQAIRDVLPPGLRYCLKHTPIDEPLDKPPLWKKLMARIMTLRGVEEVNVIRKDTASFDIEVSGGDPADIHLEIQHSLPPGTRYCLKHSNKKFADVVITIPRGEDKKINLLPLDTDDATAYPCPHPEYLGIWGYRGGGIRVEWGNNKYFVSSVNNSDSDRVEFSPFWSPPAEWVQIEEAPKTRARTNLTCAKYPWDPYPDGVA